MLDAALAVPGMDRLFLVTDTPGLFQFVTTPKMVILAAMQPSHQNKLPPPWLESAYAARIASLQADFGTGPVLVLSMRNINLNMDILRQAVLFHAESGKDIVVSVVSPDDHPCQMVTPMRLLDAGHLCLFEDTPQDILPGFAHESAVLTRPFAHLWDSLPPAGLRFQRQGSSGFSPCGEWLATPDTAQAATGLLWIWEGVETARLLCTREILDATWGEVLNPGEALAGANLLRTPSDPIAAITAGSSPNRYFFVVRPLEPVVGSMVLNVVPLAPKGIIAERASTRCFGNSSPRAAQEVSITDCNGFFYSLEEYSDSATADHFKLYTPDHDLWYYDSSRGIPVNTQTGSEISGRQQCPPIQEIDASLLVVTPEAAPLLEQLLPDLSRLAFFPVPGGVFKDDQLTLAAFQAWESPQ